MRKTHWFVCLVSVFLAIGLFAATRNEIFGTHKIKPQRVADASSAPQTFSIDSVIAEAKSKLPAEQFAKISAWEQGISRGDVLEQKISVFKKLSGFWDSVKQLLPAIWYNANAARLENSEKSLTFAAHLILENLLTEERPAVKMWEAGQAEDLFVRSLRLNPHNDSSKVGLGTVYLYGGLSNPMKGIGMIREVADRDSSNVYAQLTLGQASITSGQWDKALQRFRNVLQADPKNVQAILLMAECYEQKGEKEQAITWYQNAADLVNNKEFKTEVLKRIHDLSKTQ